MTEVLMKWLRPGETVHAAEPATCEAKPTTPPPVDLAHLRDYIGDDEDEKRIVVDMFVSGADECMAVMEAALATGDEQSWKKAAHKLKGSAANFGAEPLRALCYDAEIKFEARVDEKRALLTDIVAACDDVRRFMEA
jgi:HPt (histidine-containing phosphotransfer) domain-containing protein